MNTYQEYKKYYEKATKEQILQDTYLDYQYVKIFRKRIDEAIEYINNIGFPDWEDKLQDICVSGKSLLKILKGDANE